MSSDTVFVNITQCQHREAKKSPRRFLVLYELDCATINLDEKETFRFVADFKSARVWTFMSKINLWIIIGHNWLHGVPLVAGLSAT